MPAIRPPLTANQRFKDRSGHWTRMGLLGAVALHLGIFLVVQPFSVDALGAAEEAEIELVVPKDLRVPEPPPDIPRPSMPIVGSLDLDLGTTIDLVPFEDVPDLPVRAPSVDADPDAVRFIPYDTPPHLENEAEIGRALRREYPANLRRAGIEGRVLLWLYVDESGRVIRSQVKETSGSERLDEAAMRVADSMRFRPARNMDRPTAVWVQQWISFRIGSND